MQNDSSIIPSDFESSFRLMGSASKRHLKVFNDELAAAGEDTFRAITVRQRDLPYHTDTESIFLRFIDPNLHFNEGRAEWWGFETIWAVNFPNLMRYLYRFADKVGGTLKRVAIVRLKARAQVLEHTDEEPWLAHAHRYHLVLKTEGDDELTCNGETQSVRDGEIWWFDNKKKHAARNDSDAWRVHAIFDVEPWSDGCGLFSSRREKGDFELFMREQCLRFVPRPDSKGYPRVAASLKRLLGDQDKLKKVAHLFLRTLTAEENIEPVAAEPGAQPLAAAIAAAAERGFEGLASAAPTSERARVLVSLFGAIPPGLSHLGRHFCILNLAKANLGRPVRTRALFQPSDFEIFI